MLIVDDGGTDDTGQWLASQSAPSPVAVRAIRTERNQGFGAACNLGIREAAHPLIFLINNDLEVDEDAIAPLTWNPDRNGRALRRVRW